MSELLPGRLPWQKASMSRLWLVALAVALLSTDANAFDLPELVARTNPSVARLSILDGSGKEFASGSGFFVSSEGRLITNHHVIEDAASIRATLPDKKELNVLGVLADDEEKDIAVLQVDTREVPPLPLGDSKTLRPGDQVVVIGSPLGLSGTVSEGIVSALREDGTRDSVARDDDARLKSWRIQISAAISPGSSGSPVLTKAGDVVAVAVGTRTGGQNVNFAIPIEIAKDLLDHIDPHATPRTFSAIGRGAKKATASELLTNFGISAAAFAGAVMLYVLLSRLSARRPKKG